MAEARLASDAGRAAFMAAAVATGNVASLVFTIVFARVLGTGDYATLATLLSAFLILSVPGTALQATVARDVGRARGSAGGEPVQPLVGRWMASLAVAGVAATALAVALREPFGDLIGVDDSWGAAVTVPTAALWAIASILRGVLQGLGRYRAVGMSVGIEALLRLGAGGLLVALGLDAVGAFLGYAVALTLVSAGLALLLRGPALRAGLPGMRGESLWRLLAAAGAPAAATALLTALQNLDVVMVKREVADHDAGVYATASLVAKSVVWVAFGAGLYLLPEASRRLASGQDARRLMLATGSLTLAAGAGLLAVALVAGGPLLELLFGEDYREGDRILPLLAAAMTLLALSYLAAQYLLALRRTRFLWLLAAAAVAEPVAVALAAPDLRTIAYALLVLNAVTLAAIAVVELAGRRVSLRA